MSIIFNINGQPSGSAYIGWAPQPITIKLSAPQSSAQNIVIRSSSLPSAGAVQFLSSKTPGVLPVPAISLTLAANGTELSAFIAGKIASQNDQDVTVSIEDAASGAILAKRTIMVRIRKDANLLTIGERDRFLSAYLKFNLSTGSPNYTDFLIMHDTDANTEIHSYIDQPRYSFLVWHRAFILDLERQLQNFDASVALPFWKFDAPAPNVFTEHFMGRSTGSGTLVFDPLNPLYHWTVRGATGIIRDPLFNISSSGADIPAAPVRIKTEAQTLALGAAYARLVALEGNPHGYAHSSFSQASPITKIVRATEDPIFFLLHANVDRLWALWQSTNARFDRANVNTYPLNGAFNPHVHGNRIGDYQDDTMWPWNDDKKSPTSTRPASAPGGTFPQLAFPAVPTDKPQVWEMIDYQGYHNPTNTLADYDHISYKF